MCIVCDGGGQDEWLFSVHGSIETYGWSVVPVEHPDVNRGWAYTIGLVAGFDHPELLVRGLTPHDAGTVLNGVGEIVRAGERIRAGELIGWHEGRGGFAVRTAPETCRDDETFTGWWEYYEALGSPQPQWRALELVPVSADDLHSPSCGGPLP